MLLRCYFGIKEKRKERGMKDRKDERKKDRMNFGQLDK